ncbi:hypothetical protein [Cellulomonas fengjieae]|uniref:Uncharacterized protein n=1 Tax=Cellulomonas fengjieae TaxID=2819978 RepID=A0ABS3SJ63_9CELL|nr:hypothetical protein [Cellulomonas fengjieae]MBO3085785.1 hypothetical protein [Cellulomonas fengjieae]QVI67511.1 hypothetical protein KG102_08115 [Cellulomonas fengjieae]
MTYTKDKPSLPESTEQLRARIPGWGADLDPADRPSVPRERYDPGATGAHWDFPERQPELRPRERSIEHEFLTPVFGTVAPLHGVSGALRRLAYERYSEARAAHWLILIGADRVDAFGSHVRSLFSARPDNPVTETGIRAELTHHGIASRRGTHRVDTRHQPVDVLVVAGPWVTAAAGAALVVRAVTRRRR